MANELAEQDFKFVFVYTREAHPCDRYPGHSSFEEKLAHARDMVTRWNIERPMLVDDLAGTLHHAYGRLPNMTYIIKPGGTIIYRASWTDPRSIRLALDQILFERGERRAKRRVTPYYLEWQPQRFNDNIAFVEGLLELGERPVVEYIAATAAEHGEAAARPLVQWWEAKQSETK